MSGCLRCRNKEWHCLGCDRRVGWDVFVKDFKDIAAVYCDCCDHNFACIDCYKKNPGFDYWSNVFGANHCIYDVISGDSIAKRMLASIISMRTQPQLQELQKPEKPEKPEKPQKKEDI